MARMRFAFTDEPIEELKPLFLDPYFPIIVFLGIAVVLAVLVAVLPLLMAKQKPEADKLSPYECGFDAFGDARGKFDVRFYLVAILFIIFDLEVAFLFPFAVVMRSLSWEALAAVGIFLLILVVGFIYEWKKGALEWE